MLGSQGPETQGFLTNCWYVAAWDYEIIDGRLLERTLLEKPVVLYRGDSGRVSTCQAGLWEALHATIVKAEGQS